MRFSVLVKYEVIVVSAATKHRLEHLMMLSVKLEENTDSWEDVQGLWVSVLDVPLRRAAQREAFLGLGIHHPPKLPARLCLISPNPPSLLHLFPAPLITSDGGFA